MTNAELIRKIRNEIERRKTVQLKLIQEGDLVDAGPYDKNEAYNELLSFLSTLEESVKPMNLDLEIEIEDYIEQRWEFAENLNAAVPVYLYDMTLDELKDCARHFAQWQKEQMMKEAVEGEVMTNGFYPYEPRIVAPYPNCPYDFGDKVRVIVIPNTDEK